jgi:hypothetical protein
VSERLNTSIILLVLGSHRELVASLQNATLPRMLPLDPPVPSCSAPPKMLVSPL